MTVEEFLDFCDVLPRGEKWELHDGQPVMMVGGTAAHAIISGNLLRALFDPARRRGCRPLSGFFIRANEGSLFEPDVTVVCGSIHPQSRSSEEPVLIVEVLSPSTMRFDRVLKFERYRAMPSVEQIIHVFQENIRLESCHRATQCWRSPRSGRAWCSLTSMKASGALL